MATVEGLLGASAQSISNSYNQMGMVPGMVLQAFAKLLEDIEDRKLRREKMAWESERMGWESKLAPIHQATAELTLNRLKEEPERIKKGEEERNRNLIRSIVQAAVTTPDPSARSALGTVALSFSKDLPNAEELKDLIRETLPGVVEEKEVKETTEALKAGKTLPETKAKPQDIANLFRSGQITPEEYVKALPTKLTQQDKSQLLMSLSKLMQDKQAGILAQKPQSVTMGDVMAPGGGRSVYIPGAELVAEGNQVSGPVQPQPWERAQSAIENVSGMPPSTGPEYSTFEYNPPRRATEQPTTRVLPLDRIAQLSAGLQALRVTPEGKEILTQKQIDDIMKNAMTEFEYERSKGEPKQIPLYQILEKIRSAKPQG